MDPVEGWVGLGGEAGGAEEGEDAGGHWGVGDEGVVGVFGGVDVGDGGLLGVWVGADFDCGGEGCPVCALGDVRMEKRGGVGVVRRAEWEGLPS